MNKRDLRGRIDRIDEEMIKLFAQRMEVCADLAKLKKENGMPVTDLRREREKLREVAEQSPAGIEDYTASLYSLIFELSKSYQNRLNGTKSELVSMVENSIENTPKLFPEKAGVACQGVEGANSQFACDKLFRSANIMYFSDFEAVFSSIDKGLCKYGVIPVENSTAGSVNSVYDLMMKYHFYIVRSIRVKIQHHLLAKPGVKLENIKEIYSHQQAISQCSVFLSTLKDVKIIPCENTAAAAKMVADSDRDDIAALASRPCMKLYALSAVSENVQNTDNNYTRFICIAKEPEIYPGADRTSLMLTLPHEQGSLYKLMSILYALGINLIKLESRPLPEREFEFMFYFDLDTSVYSPRFLQLLEEIPHACENFHYLGSYSEVV